MKHILFVDDEPRVLDGLQRLLRPQRKIWQMTFVEGGRAALEALSTAPCDVIVSDLMMPDLDGVALLGLVKDSYPRMARLALSGHVDSDLSMRAVQVAHQFLTKPCDPETLKEAVERTCSLQSLLVDERLRATVGELDSLPSSPRLYGEITTALQDSEVSLAALAGIVEQDIAMSVKCLQIVNSAFFGLPRRLNSIQQAVTFLGAGMLRNLVCSTEVFRIFEPDPRLIDFDCEALERRSMLTASLASRLLTDRQQADQACLAAMLLGTGQLILASRLPQLFAELLTESGTSGRSLADVELEQIGVTHAEIGAYLLGLWGLPFPIVEAVANHLAPARVPQSSFGVLGAVHVADGLVTELSTTTDGGTSLAAIDDAYLDALSVVERLPGWRALALQVSAGED